VLNFLVSLGKESFPKKKSISQKATHSKIRKTPFDLYHDDFPNSDLLKILIHYITTPFETFIKTLARSNDQIESYVC
jgi:hypothetical protein